MKRLLIKTGLYWFWISIIVLVIDLNTKFVVSKCFSLKELLPLCPFLNLYYVHNYGAAFSIFSKNNICYHSWLLVIIPICVCVSLLILMYLSQASQRLRNISYALVNGGTLGNLFERIWHGFVTDMIDFHIGNWHFSTFNIADSAIFIGAVLFLLEDFFLESDWVSGE